jgi:hypothetical protein
MPAQSYGKATECKVGEAGDDLKPAWQVLREKCTMP